MTVDIMGRCKRCRYWDTRHALNMDLSGGICVNTKLAEDWGYEADMLVYSYRESGFFWTGPEFGCVHFDGKDEEPN